MHNQNLLERHGKPFLDAVPVAHHPGSWDECGICA